MVCLQEMHIKKREHWLKGLFQGQNVHVAATLKVRVVMTGIEDFWSWEMKNNIKIQMDGELIYMGKWIVRGRHGWEYMLLMKDRVDLGRPDDANRLDGQRI